MKADKWMMAYFFCIPNAKGRKVYCSSQFVEISVHNWLTPRQGDMAEAKPPMAGRRQETKVNPVFPLYAIQASP